MIKDLAELLTMYAQGVWSRGDFFYQITLLVPAFSVQAIIDELPEPDRLDFVSWLRQTYDNDLPAEEFVTIGRQEDTAMSRVRISQLRTWLRVNSSEMQ
jgi:hypothetical protein